MRNGLRSFVRAALLAVVLVFAMAAPLAAQEEPPITPVVEQKGGICAPWHRCLAYGGIAITVLTLGALGVGYLVQSKGFDTLEHRMGQPQGAPKKE